jgi:acetylornithine deacetylase/succinyl-diaminopimelate desuccinylase-like protein
MVNIQELETKLDNNFDKYLQELKELASIPSISNLNFDQGPSKQKKELLVKKLQDLGCSVKVSRSKFETGEGYGAENIIATKLAPRTGADTKTVLLYAHYDVQPVNSPEDWKTDPWTPTEIGDRLYGRGVADDTCGVIQHLALLDLLGDDLSNNIIILIEGEEEVGSPSYTNFVKDNFEDLKNDVTLIADAGQIELGIPTITATLRGVQTINVELEVLEHDVHSGEYSGPVLDPFILMSRLLTELHDEKGELVIPGLVNYDDNYTGYDEKQYRLESSVLDNVELAGTGSIGSRIWTKPTITLTGLDIPKPEHASNVIARSAKAVISLRTAPGQDEKEAFNAVKTFLEHQAEFGIKPKVTLENSGPSYKANLNTDAVEKIKQAYKEVWGMDTVFAGMGGSIPLTNILENFYPDSEILVTAAADPDSRPHSANESLSIPELKKLILAEALFVSSL